MHTFVSWLISDEDTASCWIKYIYMVGLRLVVELVEVFTKSPDLNFGAHRQLMHSRTEILDQIPSFVHLLGTSKNMMPAQIYLVSNPYHV